MVQALRIQCMNKSLKNVFLSHHLFEVCRSPFSGKNLIAHDVNLCRNNEKKVLTILHARELYKQFLVFEFDALESMSVCLQYFDSHCQLRLIEIILKLLKARLHGLT